MKFVTVELLKKSGSYGEYDGGHAPTGEAEQYGNVTGVVVGKEVVKEFKVTHSHWIKSEFE